jgi:hypothetical protein
VRAWGLLGLAGWLRIHETTHALVTVSQAQSTATRHSRLLVVEAAPRTSSTAGRRSRSGKRGKGSIREPRLTKLRESQHGVRGTWRRSSRMGKPVSKAPARHVLPVESSVVSTLAMRTAASPWASGATTPHQARNVKLVLSVQTSSPSKTDDLGSVGQQVPAVCLSVDFLDPSE